MNIFRSSTQGLLTKKFLKVTKTMTYISLKLKTSNDFTLGWI